jgi:peptidyl-prolyl cis-trans isomerase A (cyclophilin A)
MVKRIVLMLVCSTLAAAAQSTPAAAPKASPSAAQKSSTPAPAKNPEAIFHTTAGDIKCELFPNQAPKTVTNFIGLATGKKDWTNPASGSPMHNTPLYDNTIFHRVIPNFMVQGGDPLGQGIGGPGYKFEDEFDPSLAFDQPGRLAMANSGPNTNGSQFFITDVPTPWLNGRHTIFGQCDQSGQEVVKKIEAMPCMGGMPCTGQNSRQMNPVKITHIEIITPGAPAAQKKTGSTGKTSPKAAPKASPKSSPTPKQ